MDVSEAVCQNYEMDAFDTIIAHLHAARDEAGSLAKLLNRLNLACPQSRMTLSRALDPDVPKLPGGETLCCWIDALGLKLVTPMPPMPEPAEDDAEDEGCRIRLMEPGDLLLPPESWPYRGSMRLPTTGLAARDLDPLTLGAIVAKRGMPPAVVPGDIVVVDASEGRRLEKLDGDMHVVDLDGRPQIRRIQRMQDGWLLSSDTPGIVPVEIRYGKDWPCEVLACVVGVIHYT